MIWLIGLLLIGLWMMLMICLMILRWIAKAALFTISLTIALMMLATRSLLTR